MDEASLPNLECVGCNKRIEDEENWSCINEAVPVAGSVRTYVLLHVHGHLRCFEGMMRWRALRSLGLETFREN
jgi:hypothetical protein